MSELYEQSLIKLELDRVLALLADKAGCPAAAERCRALRPMTEPDDVRRALAETSAACRLMQREGVPVNDLFAVMDGHEEELVSDDLIHPTEQAVQLLADRVASCILDMLDREEGK